MKIEDLNNFTGTEQWYRHSLNRSFLYTDGIQYLAENAGAYWLIDEIALANKFVKSLDDQEFQLWTLTKTGSSATLVCDDGDGNVLFTKPIPFTDFPFDSIKMYVEGDGENRVLLLPSEH
jgi:hypothetical protein